MGRTSRTTTTPCRFERDPLQMNQIKFVSRSLSRRIHDRPEGDFCTAFSHVFPEEPQQPLSTQRRGKSRIVFLAFCDIQPRVLP